MIRAIAWKEFREQGLIALTLIVLGGGLLSAAAILADWATYRGRFRKVMPVEYRRALAEQEKIRTMQAAE